MLRKKLSTDEIGYNRISRLSYFDLPNVELESPKYRFIDSEGKLGEIDANEYMSKFDVDMFKIGNVDKLGFNLKPIHIDLPQLFAAQQIELAISSLDIDNSESNNPKN